MPGPPLDSYGPVQLGDRLRLTRFQVARARDAGLIPAPDRNDGRWSLLIVNQLSRRSDRIRKSVGSVPDLGASRAAAYLAEKLGVEVTPDAVAELATQGLLCINGDFRGCPLYDGQVLERFTDAEAASRAVRDGELLTAEQATERLRIRRSDLDHLVRAGLLGPAAFGRSVFQRRRDAPNVALYRAGDLTALLDRDDIDWDAVRATPKGFHSPLAKLPTAVALAGACWAVLLPLAAYRGML